MHVSFSRLEVWVRGILITVAAVLAFLLNAPAFRQMVSPKVLMVLGAILVAVLSIRGFIDKSTAGHKADEAATLTSNALLVADNGDSNSSLESADATISNQSDTPSDVPVMGSVGADVVGAPVAFASPVTTPLRAVPGSLSKAVLVSTAGNGGRS